jgi:TolB-like protein/tetratricopeptide (TPR) repeat protein
MNAAKGPIFLSYASQDAIVAASIGDTLRAAGFDVWFDQSELRGGDAWDQLIRRRIRDCALFVPIISAHTQSRLEGYFRLEWRLAVERSRLMAEGKAFIVPITVDAIDERQAEVPEAFRAVQWTHLPGGAVTPAFSSRLGQLLSGQQAIRSAAVESSATVLHVDPAIPAAGKFPAHASKLPLGMPILLGLVTLGAGWLLFDRFHSNTPATIGAPAAATRIAAQSTPSAFSPPEHSLAVLPFTNMSGDPNQEYFSDGLTEELLNTLASIHGLQVAARTSSFSFKNKNEAVGEIARKLNVGAVLEGSVRRDKAHVRISTELINAITGFQLWSQTYDRDMKDVLALQTDIASAVSSALKVKLLQNGSSGADIGGTDNPKAFDAYLRAQEIARQPLSAQALANAVAGFDEAIALDPQFANAYLARGGVRMTYAFNFNLGVSESTRLGDLALADSRKAAELAPGLGAAHSQIGYKLEGELKFAEAAAEFEKGLTLSPGDARTNRLSGLYLVTVGRFDEGIELGKHAVELDPLNPQSYSGLAYTYYMARHYAESIAQNRRALESMTETARVSGWMGLGYIGLGDSEAARAACDVTKAEWVNITCLAIAYHNLGRQPEAAASLATLLREFGDSASYQQADIYAQWGDIPLALAALERAFRTRDPGISWIKVDPLLDPLRKEPRFKSVLASLHFPD